MEVAAPCVQRHLLVPTVSDGEHPLLVDEHAAAEVVSVVEGGHVWTGVRLALPPANDPAIPARNRRNCTHAQNRPRRQEESDALPSALQRRVGPTDRVSVCVCTGLPAAPSTSSSRASDLMVSDELIRGHQDAPSLDFICSHHFPLLSQLSFF